MADEAPGTDTNGNPPAGAADQPPSPTGITADQVKQMIAEAVAASEKKAYDRGAADARRAEQRKQSTQPTTKPTESPSEGAPAPQPAAAVDGFALGEALSEFTLSKEQRKTIRDLANKESPEDLDAFVERWAGLFGAKKAGDPASTNNNPAPTENKPQNPPQPGPSLPAPGSTPDRQLVSVFKAMGEDAARDTWQAYVRQRGANPGNPYDPKNRAVWREMRKVFEGGLATASVQIGARRGS